MMRVLVTGAAGMIGSHAVDALIARGDEVVAVDDLSRGDQRNVSSAATFVKLDITNAQAVASLFAQHGPFDTVLHEAALINAGIDAEDVDQDIAVNIDGTLNLLRAAAKHGVRRFVYASSVAVYGRPTQLPASELTTVPAPIASYGVGKLAAEHYVRYIADAAGMTHACLRYSNIYGPRQKPFGEVGVIGIFVERVAEGAALVQHGDGSQCRDFLYVDDCISATLAALESSENFVVNVGTGEPTTVSSLLAALKDVAGGRVRVEQAQLRHGELGRFWCDTSLAEELLAWRPGTSLRDGLRRTLEWRMAAG